MATGLPQVNAVRPGMPDGPFSRLPLRGKTGACRSCSNALATP